MLPDDIRYRTDETVYASALTAAFTNGVPPHWYSSLDEGQQSYLVSNLIPGDLTTTLRINQVTATTSATDSSSTASGSGSPSARSGPRVIEPTPTSTSFPAAESGSSTGHNSNHLAIIAGVTIPCGLLLLLLIAELLIFRRLRRQKRRNPWDDNVSSSNEKPPAWSPSADPDPPPSRNPTTSAAAKARQLPEIPDTSRETQRAVHSENAGARKINSSSGEPQHGQPDDNSLSPLSPTMQSVIGSQHSGYRPHQPHEANALHL